MLLGAPNTNHRARSGDVLMSNSRLVTGACIDGYALCINCAHELHSDDTLLTEWSPIYAGTEWDAPGPTCDNCHEPIDVCTIEEESE